MNCKWFVWLLNSLWTSLWGFFSFSFWAIKPLKYKIPFSRPELWFLLLPPGMKGSTISHLYHEQLFRIYSIKKQFNNPTWKFHPATIHSLQCMTMCQLSYLQLFGSSWLAHTFNTDSFHNYFICLSLHNAYSFPLREGKHFRFDGLLWNPYFKSAVSISCFLHTPPP